MNDKKWRYLQTFTGLDLMFVIFLFANDLREWGIACAVLGMMMLTVFTVYKFKKGACRTDPDQTPLPTISSSVDHDPPPIYPITLGPLTFTSLFDEYSPTNASQAPDASSTVYMLAPSAPVLQGYRGSTDVEAATVLAANQPPPSYPEVIGGNHGLPPRSYTTHATGEGPEKVCEPSNDGLPSYEAAMSTRQSPAYEAPGTPRDDGPTTND